MGKLPRRTAIIVGFAAALLGGGLAPTGVAVAASIPAPVLTGPADNTTTPLKDVVLTWDTVAGAGKYQVQVSPNGEWTNNTVTLPNKGFTVNNLYEMPLSLPHDSYFWRVRAQVGTTWGPFSSVRQFLREWESPITVLHAPTTSNPTVSWAPVPQASEYLVRFSSDSSFPSDPAVTHSCITNQTSFTPYLLLSTKENANGTCFGVEDLPTATDFYWAIEPLDDSTDTPLAGDTVNDPLWDCTDAQPECDGDRFFSTSLPTAQQTFHFVAPGHGVVDPTDTVTGLTTTYHSTALPGTTCNTTTTCATTPTFSWSAVPNANYYRVQVFRDPDLTNTYRTYDTSWTTLTPRDSFFDAQAGHAYYWTVEAGTCDNGDGTCDNGGTETKTLVVGSAAQSFTKTSGTVTLGTPASGTTVHGHTVTFNWSDYQSSGGNGVYDARNYELQVAKDDSFDNPVFDDANIDLTRFTDPAAALTNGHYFWRVAPIDESGNVLAWSATQDLTINSTAPSISITSKDGIAVTGPISIHVSEPISGVSSNTVQVVPAGEGAGGAIAGTLKLGSSSTAYVFRPKHALATGQRYNLSVSPSLVDANGNSAVVKGNGVRTTTVAQDTSKGWTYHGTWTRHKASGARSGTYKSAKHGATATLSVVGSNATLFACKGPSMGKVTVTVGGKSQTVNEHQSFTKCGASVWHGPLPAGQTKISVKVSKGEGNLDELVLS